MRPDVKLGVVLSSVIVLVAGTYYFYRDKQEVPIEVASDSPALDGVESTAGPANAASEGSAGRSALRQGAASQGAGLADSRPRSSESAAPGGQRPVPFAAATPSDKAATSNAAKRTHQRQTAQRRPVVNPKRLAGAGTRPGSNSSEARNATGGSLGRDPQRPSGARSSKAGSVRQPVSLTAKRPAASKAQGTGPADGNEAAIETHRVQRGDTLSSLAQRYYGDTGLARFLADSNPHIADASHPRVGQLVKIPSRPAHSPSRPGGVQRPTTKTIARTYHVKKGDSFYKIAGDVLGDSSRWKELFDLNKELVGGDPKRLKPGQEVTLPSP